MEWGSIAAAITSICCLGTIFYYIWDSSRYRRERQRNEDEFTGHLKERLENIDDKLESQVELCFKERKGLWDRTDENSEAIAFIKGKLNGSLK